MDSLAAARRRLRRGLVFTGLWPLQRPYGYSLHSFVAEIKDAGELDLYYADAEIAGANSESHILARLYEVLDCIVNDIEFSIYCF